MNCRGKTGGDINVVLDGVILKLYVKVYRVFLMLALMFLMFFQIQLWLVLDEITQT